MSWRYAAHGYAVDSDIPLPLPPHTGQQATASMRLRRATPRQVPTEPADGEILALLEHDAQTHYAITRTAGRLTLRFGGCVEFVGDDQLREMAFHVDPGQDEELAAVLAAGTLLAVRLLVEGELVLHASSLQLGGSAVAFCGAPGMGKSTIAAMVSQAGHPLVTDDVLRVSLDGECPLAWPGATESRLRAGAFGIADEVPPASVRDTADGRRAVRAPALSHSPLPLAAIIVPLPTRGIDRPEVRRLTKAEALMSLVRFPRVIGWRDAATIDRQFQLLGELMDRLPVAEARIPWGPPFPADLAEQIIAVADAVRYK